MVAGLPSRKGLCQPVHRCVVVERWQVCLRPGSTIEDLLTLKHNVFLWFTSLGATAVEIFFFPSDEGVRALAGCTDNGEGYFTFATAPFAIGMFASWIALIAVATWIAHLAKAKAKR